MVSLNEGKSSDSILKTKTHAGLARSQLRISEGASRESQLKMTTISSDSAEVLDINIGSHAQEQ